MSERDVMFISHATPDDNGFVRWLGTRLTGYGYKVWADIFDLAGGSRSGSASKTRSERERSR
jgi:hypothetical protein